MRFSQEFRLESLAFIAFFATLPLYSPNLVLFSEYGAAETLMPSFVNAMMLASVLAGLFSAWVAHRYSFSGFVHPPFIVGATVLYLGGFVLFAVSLSAGGFVPEAVMVGAGVAVAFGMVPLCIAWGTYLSMLDLRQALFYLAIMVGIASLIELMLSSIAFEAGLLVYGLLLLIGVALPCVKSITGSLSRGLGSRGGSEDREFGYLVGRSAVGGEAKAGALALVSNIKRMASVAALPFIGLLVFAFVMSVRKFMVFETFYVETLGGIVAAVVVLPLCLLKSNRPLLSFIYQVFLPICAVALIVLNAFPFGTTAQWLAASFSYVFYGIIGIIALASLCAMAHAREFSPAFIYGLAVACFMAVSFVGIMCGASSIFADNAGPILLVVSTLYFGFVVLAPLIAAWRREGVAEPGRSQEIGEGEAQSDLQKRCEEVALRFELSPREAEILSYLGRGHGIVFIAKTLVISESTVRTHVKSIYRKLEVSSREQLIELIDKK
ncbi:MAG: helix-turn-helix transcriptional regulator [Raoultibacter sp.]